MRYDEIQSASQTISSRIRRTECDENAIQGMKKESKVGREAKYLKGGSSLVEGPILKGNLSRRKVVSKDVFLVES